VASVDLFWFKFKDYDYEGSTRSRHQESLGCVARSVHCCIKQILRDLSWLTALYFAA
jgi:hypothetical protein